MVLIALIIIIVILAKRNRDNGEEFESEYLPQQQDYNRYDQTLADDSLQCTGQLNPHLVLTPGRAGINDTLHRLGSTCCMKGA